MGAFPSFCVSLVQPQCPLAVERENTRLYLQKEKVKKKTTHEIRSALVFLFGFFKAEKGQFEMRGRIFLQVKTRYFNGKDTSLGFYAAQLCRAGKLYKNGGVYPKGISVFQQISATLYMHQQHAFYFSKRCRFLHAQIINTNFCEVYFFSLALLHKILCKTKNKLRHLKPKKLLPFPQRVNYWLEKSSHALELGHILSGCRLSQKHF